MSFYKLYPNRKDQRSPYHRGCRNRSGCTYCERGRQHQTSKANVSFREQVKELEEPQPKAEDWVERIEEELFDFYQFGNEGEYLRQLHKEHLGAI